MMKPTVYVESSVVSYLTARPSRDLVVAAHQQVTAEWWETVLPQVDAFVSELVVEEVSKGDADAASRRLAHVKRFPLLNVNEEVERLAQIYASELGLPEKAVADAYHMALATWHGMDYLVSWNCTHIASGRVQRALVDVNGGLDYGTPVLCTPEELMEV